MDIQSVNIIAPAGNILEEHNYAVPKFPVAGDNKSVRLMEQQGWRDWQNLMDEVFGPRLDSKNTDKKLGTRKVGRHVPIFLQSKRKRKVVTTPQEESASQQVSPSVSQSVQLQQANPEKTTEAFNALQMASLIRSRPDAGNLCLHSIRLNSL